MSPEKNRETISTVAIFLSFTTRSEDKREVEVAFRAAMGVIADIECEVTKEICCDLYGAARLHRAWVESINSSELGGIQPRFREQVTSKLPGAVLALPPTMVKGHIPDAWVLYEGERIPVEVKRDAFDAEALSQLKRYMSAYGTKRGVAAAPKLTTDLPPDVVFVQVH